MSRALRHRYTRYVTYRLDWVSQRTREEADAVYRRECGLDIRHLRILRVVAETPDQTVSAIVDRALFERTSVSRLITQLVAMGFITRRICDEDARQFRIGLTESGAAMVRRADRLGDALNDDLLSTLTPAERRTLETCLDKLVRWRPRGAREGNDGRLLVTA